MTQLNGLTPVGNGLTANDGGGVSLRSGAALINTSWTAIAQAVNALAAGQTAGGVSYPTKDDMDADAKPDGTVALVWNDSTPGNNQSWVRSSGAWVKATDRLAQIIGNGAGFQAAGAGSVVRSLQDRLRDDVHVKDKTSAIDGVTDNSAAIIQAHSLGQRVTYTPGVYIYTDGTQNPSLAGGVAFDNARVDGAHHQDILRFDRNLLVGLQHNHQEDSNVTLGGNLAIISGSIVPPPLSRADIASPVDIVAHWYQDFGLEFTRAGNGANGSLTWYYWAWNHASSGHYDPQRHPLLGFYRGDDANVLDWQCYWLREHGVTAVSLFPSTDVSVATWATPSDKLHWLYQLFNNVPNFKGLRYLLWGKYDGTSSDITSAWNYMVDNLYLAYPNFYAVEVDGKLYPAIYVFEGGTLDANIGGTASAFLTFASGIAAKFQAAGYGGVALFVRHPKADSSRPRRDLAAAGVMYYAMDYAGHGAWLNNDGSTARMVIPASSSYATSLAQWKPTHAAPQWASGVNYAVDGIVSRRGAIWACTTAHTSSTDTCPGEGKSQSSNWIRINFASREVCAVPTSKYAVAPHPSAGSSAFSMAGTTPDLFRAWMRKAIDSVINAGSARIVAIYNVSEWAEGGPGLQPNVSDGFGYLQALRDALTTSKAATKAIVPKDLSSTFQPRFVGATSTIPCDFADVRLSTDAARTMTSTPTINPGADNQRLRLTNANSAFVITLQDNATLAGSGLFLTASTIALGPYDSIEVQYFAGKGWVQIGNVVNVL